MKHRRNGLRHCPNCHNDQIIKNGTNSTGKPKYACKACRHQFVDDPQWRVISDDIKALIDRLLLERISLAGIARAVQVSESWLQAYVNEQYQAVPREVRVRSKKGSFDHRMRRAVVVRGQEAQEAMGMAGA